MTKKDVKILTGAIVIIIIDVIISLVYAGFTGQLNINGTSVNRKSNWDIHFENLSSITTTGSAKVLSNPSLDGTTTIEDYSVSMTSPGDTISFTFKVVNDGNYNASISSINIGTPSCTGTDETSNTNVCGKLTYSLTDENGSAIQVGDVVYAKDSVTMKVTLLYQDFSDASLLPTSDVSIGGLGITINYEQSGSALVKDNGEVANYLVYHQGTKITLNNEDYWVIEDSGADKDYVVALKDTPLTAQDIQNYKGDLTFNTSGNGMQYGINSTYAGSYVETVVNNWTSAIFLNDELKEVEGYKARLITTDELVTLGCTSNNCINSSYSWTYNSSYWYWTMTPYNSSYVWFVNTAGDLRNGFVDGSSALRPVINVYKDKISS